MPRVPARIRRRYVEGVSEVLDWATEEVLVFGVPLVFGPPCPFKTADEWRLAWERWRGVIEPKVREYRPGTRAFALYALGEIPRRELRLPLPEPNGFWTVGVRERDGSVTEHYLNVPMPWVKPEATHLRDLGLVDVDELRRHRAWVKRGTFDTYPLEMAIYQ